MARVRSAEEVAHRWWRPNRGEDELRRESRWVGVRGECVGSARAAWAAWAVGRSGDAEGRRRAVSEGGGGDMLVNGCPGGCGRDRLVDRANA
eukprot:6187996-Prymnesium_polylepis.2